jgi:hypothetical protein
MENRFPFEGWLVLQARRESPLLAGHLFVDVENAAWCVQVCEQTAGD